MRWQRKLELRRSVRIAATKIAAQIQRGIITWQGGLNSEYWIHQAKTQGYRVILRKGYAELWA